MQRKSKLLVTIVGILLLLGVLGATTISASTQFVSPTNISDEYTGERVNLEGRVTDHETMGQVITFNVTDGNQSIPVVYKGTLPDTMQEGRIVVAKGLYQNGTLDANQISVRAHEGIKNATSAG